MSLLGECYAVLTWLEVRQTADEGGIYSPGERQAIGRTGEPIP